MKTSAFKFISLVIISIVLLYLRRPDQFTAPHIWAEDGTYNIPSVLEHGIGALFTPVSGFLVVPAKIITYLSLLISGPYYPEVSTALAVLLNVGVVVAVAYSPTILTARYLCALSLLLIPCDVEPHAVPLMAFWFTTLLTILASIWTANPTTNQRKLQIAFIIIGGLSSPVGIALLPIFFIRAFVYRNRGEIAAFITALALAAVQYVVLQTYDAYSTPTGLSFSNLGHVFERYFSWYLFYPFKEENITIYLAVSVFISITALGVRAWCAGNKTPAVLFSLFLITILISVARIPIDWIDPYLAGPRYYFYPYIMLSWTLLSLWGNATPREKSFLGVLFLLIIINSTHRFSRYHDHISWREELSLCIRTKGDHKPRIHSDGNIAHTWRMKQLSHQDCKTLANSGIWSGKEYLRRKYR